MSVTPKYLPILELLNACPKEELYRLQVDGNLLAKENGWIKYQGREPDSISSFFNAFAFALTNLECKNITLDSICTLHKLCTDGVQNLKPNTPGTIRKENCRAFFGLSKDNTSIEGLFDLLKLIREHKNSKLEAPLIILGKPTGHPTVYLSKEQSGYPDYVIVNAIYNKLDSNEIYFFTPQGGQILERRLNEIIANFNEKIGGKSGNDALEFIVETIYQIYHEHPYGDANLRTICLLLMNRLLIQQGFLPVIFDDPNCFDGNSIRQVIAEVNKGREKTRMLLLGEKKLNNFDTSTIASKSNFLMTQLVKVFSDQINAEIQRLNENKNIPVDNIKFFSQSFQKMKTEQAAIEETIEKENKSTLGSDIILSW